MLSSSGGDEQQHAIKGLPEPQVTERWRSNKLALLTIGVAVVLVANITYLGILTPPRPPVMPLTALEARGQATPALDGDPTHGFANFIVFKLGLNASDITPNAAEPGIAQLSITDYAAIYQTIDPLAFCDIPILTAYRALNGFTFMLAVATLFVVAIVPVFVQRAQWDRRIARVGAGLMSLCMLMFITSFLLGAFVSAGAGNWTCTSPLSPQGLIELENAPALIKSSWAILGVACFLLVLVVAWTLVERFGHRIGPRSAPKHAGVPASSKA